LGNREHLLLVQQYPSTHHRSCWGGNSFQKLRWTTCQGGQASRFTLCRNAICWCRCQNSEGQRHYRPPYSSTCARRARSANTRPRCAGRNSNVSESRLQNRSDRRCHTCSTRRNAPTWWTQRKTCLDLNPDGSDCWILSFLVSH
jgi:hypothetical protein